MMKLLVSVCALSLFAGSVMALEISVAPKTLVLSSKGGSFTIHTDIPFWLADDVTLVVNETTIEAISTFADDCGNLVVQCSKDTAKTAIVDFEGKTTTATVTLVVDNESDSEEFCVKK